MRISLYLSRKCDKDLISLYYQLGKQGFVKLAKYALRSLVRPKLESFPLTVLPRKFDGDGSLNNFVPLTFGDKRDADVVSLLKKTDEGMKSTFIKNAIRFYLGPSYSLKFCFGQALGKVNYPVGKEVVFLPIEPVAVSVVKEVVKVTGDTKKEEVSETTKTESKVPVPAPVIHEVPPEPVYVPKMEIPSIPEPVKEPEESSSELSEDDILSILENL